MKLTNKFLGPKFFSTDDTAKIISHLNPNKPHAHDMLNIQMMKLCGNSFNKPLLIIFTDYLNEKNSV